jgi:hypothetical protein
MAVCKHPSPSVTGVDYGTDAQGKAWTETHYECGLCGITWSVVTGPGIKD